MTDEVVAAVATLLEMGVTGRILVANYPSPFGVPVSESFSWRHRVKNASARNDSDSRKLDFDILESPPLFPLNR